MKMATFALVGIVGLTAVPCAAQNVDTARDAGAAQDVGTARDSGATNPRDVLREAAKAASAVRTAIYNVAIDDSIGLLTPVPQMRGAVKLQRRAEGDPPMALGGKVAMRGKVLQRLFRYDPKNPDYYFALVHDGNLLRIRFASKTWVIEIDQRRHADTVARRPEMTLLMRDLLSPRPFAALLGASSVTFGGKHDVEGQTCDRVDVRVAPPSGPEGASPLAACVDQRWYFAESDHLPRRVEYLPPPGTTGPGAAGRVVVTFTDVKVNGTLAAALFELPRAHIWARTLAEPIPPPPAFPTVSRTKPPATRDDAPGRDRDAIRDQRRDDRRQGEPKPVIPGVGDPAPTWELKDLDGRTVALSDFRGKVVVMDFWATWCPKCRKARPVLQALYAKYKDRPTAFVSIHCIDRSGDPVAYLKNVGYTYTQLLKGNKVAKAYGVKSIPYIVVIDKKGGIVRSESGYTPTLGDELSSVIDRALNEP